MRRLVVAALLLAACAAPRAAPAVLRWGGDAEGGAPFVEADATDPAIVRGFDVEVADLLAKGMGRTAQFTQVAWASIPQSVERGDVDVGLSGIEDAPGLRAQYAVSRPYYEFREVLAVRPADTTHFRTLADLRGRRVGTLGSTGAYRMLLEAAAEHGVVPVSYDDDVHPYTDLAEGRVDAVLLDHIIAERAVHRTHGIVVQPQALGVGHYVAVFARRDAARRDSADALLASAMRDGRLEAIFRRWGVWGGQGAFFARALGGTAGAELRERVTAGAGTAGAELRERVTAGAGTAGAEGRGTAGSGWASIPTYLPALLRGTLLTLLISLAAMALAVSGGAAIAAGRVYGGPLARASLGAYVEVVRGTPVLLQLFVLYYGLSSVIRLPAMLAAILGLGLNYAAYESEIYRSALEAIARAQLEAARTLGLSEWQIFRLVRGPQAFRLALAPMTNDFVALLKDSSLVSVITVVELTKQTAIYATNVGSWAVPGLLCAAFYLALSLPLSRLARGLETRWSGR